MSDQTADKAVTLATDQDGAKVKKKAPRPFPVSPCVNCKKRPYCPRICYPLRDWEKAMKRKGAFVE